MAKRYPRSEYFLKHDGDGLITYDLRENISEWRDGVMEHLRNRGTFEACRQIERIVVELPELRDTLKWTLPTLWNQAGKSHRPKDEDWFTDYVAQHFREDLRGRGVVLGREVVIRKGEGEGRGERTDVHVDAVVRGSEPDVRDTISVIIEAKGCWNGELETAMEEQLASRYLVDNPSCRYGLYLVGWFNCGRWDTADYRRGRAPKYSLEEARERFAEQARALSERGPRVRSVVVNAALR